MTTQGIREFQHLTLHPQKTQTITRRNPTTARTLEIHQKDTTNNGQKKVYDVHASRTALSSKSTVTITHPSTDQIVAGARFDSKHDNIELFTSDDNKAIELRETDADEPLDLSYTFDFEGQRYAWTNTTRHSIRVPAGSSEKQETTGADFKLVAVKGEKPGLEDEILAAYLQPVETLTVRFGRADLYWFGDGLGERVEGVCLAGILGLQERVRRSRKASRSGTSLLFG